MPNSFRFDNNTPVNAETLKILIEGISTPVNVLNKTCTIKVHEIDKGAIAEELAIFTSKVTSPTTGSYKFESVSRTDSNPTTAISGGWVLPHFNINLDGATDHTIVFPKVSQEEEFYYYRICFQIYVDGNLLFSSKPTKTIVNYTSHFSTNCVTATKKIKNDHDTNIASRGIGTAYGSQYVPHDLTQHQKEITTYGLIKTSCIGYVLQALKNAHKQSYAEKDYKKIYSFVKDGKGTTLAKGLEAAGWQGIYFNQDTKNPCDLKDDGNPTKSEHSYSYAMAKKTRKYYNLKVHGFVINFRPTTEFNDTTKPTTITTKDSGNITKLRTIPFGVINTKGGTHTALLINGKVYEVHWDNSQYDLDLYDITDFENDWDWISGIIHIPRGIWT
ncbi:MAG: hypothetical protein OCD01_19590 [Fibrobacterales bacterium]